MLASFREDWNAMDVLHCPKSYLKTSFTVRRENRNTRKFLLLFRTTNYFLTPSLSMCLSELPPTLRKQTASTLHAPYLSKSSCICRWKRPWEKLLMLIHNHIEYSQACIVHKKKHWPDENPSKQSYDSPAIIKKTQRQRTTDPPQAKEKTKNITQYKVFNI